MVVDKAKVTVTKSNVPTVQKSQRYIDHEEIEDDLNISEPMQEFVYKKLSERINDAIEFVEVPTKKIKKDKHKVVEEVTGGVRLLNDTDIIQDKDYLDVEPLQNELIGQSVTRKPTIKRRIIEPDELGKDEKLKLCVIEGDEIIQQTETKSWKPKKVRPEKVFNYREKKSVLYLQEPQNEFTALRKKNNWTENKIANFYKNQKKS